MSKLLRGMAVRLPTAAACATRCRARPMQRWGQKSMARRWYATSGRSCAIRWGLQISRLPISTNLSYIHYMFQCLNCSPQMFKLLPPNLPCSISSHHSSTTPSSYRTVRPSNT